MSETALEILRKTESAVREMDLPAGYSVFTVAVEIATGEVHTAIQIVTPADAAPVMPAGLALYACAKLSNFIADEMAAGHGWAK